MDLMDGYRLRFPVEWDDDRDSAFKRYPAPSIGWAYDDLVTCINVTEKVREDLKMNDRFALARNSTVNKAMEIIVRMIQDGAQFITWHDIMDAIGVKERYATKDSSLMFEPDVFDFKPDKTLTEAAKARLKQMVENVYDATYLYEKLPYGLTPVSIWITKYCRTTTVEWSDGTKTTVTAEDPRLATPYGGFCACLARKLYSGTSEAIRLMDKAFKHAEWPAERKRIENEKRKALKAEKVKHRREEREKQIHIYMDRIRMRKEAERRVAQEEESK